MLVNNWPVFVPLLLKSPFIWGRGDIPLKVTRYYNTWLIGNIDTKKPYHFTFIWGCPKSFFNIRWHTTRGLPNSLFNNFKGIKKNPFVITPSTAYSASPLKHLLDASFDFVVYPSFKVLDKFELSSWTSIKCCQIYRG